MAPELRTWLHMSLALTAIGAVLWRRNYSSQPELVAFLGLAGSRDAADLRPAGLLKLAGYAMPILRRTIGCWRRSHVVVRVRISATERRESKRQRRGLVKQQRPEETPAIDGPSGDELKALATRQAALRRVATLVARGINPSELFSEVAAEMARCLEVHDAMVGTCEAEDALTIVGVYNEDGPANLQVGERFTLDDDSIATPAHSSGRPTRMETGEHAPVSVAARARETDLPWQVGAPAVADRWVWGLAVVACSASHPLPPTTEARVHEFADLAATAIWKAATRAELRASRKRIVAAADDARRRLERDLHDGAQQRLALLGIEVRMAQASVPPELDDLKSSLSNIVSGLADISEELRALSHGIHPAILAQGGLGPALEAMARRSVVPVTLDLALDGRLSESVEVAAYYVVAEALTNVTKHAHAREVSVHAAIHGDHLDIAVCDNGIGGADPGNGSGLIGLTDRVEALGGCLRVISPSEVGTSLAVTIPIDGVL